MTLRSQTPCQMTAGKMILMNMDTFSVVSLHFFNASFFNARFNVVIIVYLDYEDISNLLHSVLSYAVKMNINRMIRTWYTPI